MTNRVKLAERLVQIDPVEWKIELERAQNQAAAF
jgi:multidrug resistance efflux pump